MLELQRPCGPVTGAEGREHAHAVVFEPPQRDPEHAGRGRIDPLRIVQRHHYRPVRGQHPQDIEHGQPDRVCIGALLAGSASRSATASACPRGAASDRETYRRPGRRVPTGPRTTAMPPPPRPGRKEHDRNALWPARRLSPREPSCRSPPHPQKRAPAGRPQTPSRNAPIAASSSSRPMTALAIVSLSASKSGESRRGPRRC